jgi:hypothetical protein
MHFLLCLLYLVCASMPSTASYFNGGKKAKCADGTEVSEDDCFAAALEVWGYPNIGFAVGTWNHTPCGCFTWKQQAGYFAAHYKNPAAGSCTASNKGTNICTTALSVDPSIKPSTVPSFEPSTMSSSVPSTSPSTSIFNGGKNTKCVVGTEVDEVECYAAAREVWAEVTPYPYPTFFKVVTLEFTPCGCFIWKARWDRIKVLYKNPAGGSCTADNRATNICTTTPRVDPSSKPSTVPSFEPSTMPSSVPSTSPSTSPSSAPTFESVSHEMCENFAVHARTTVTFDGVTSTVQDGDVGVYPGTSITGSHQFVNGVDVQDSRVFADHVVDSHASAMEGNYGTSETAMEIEIGGMTFLPGIYRSGSAINFAHGTVVTLDGNGEANPEFIFIAGSTLVTAADTEFILENGAKAENIIWVLGTAATLGARSHVAGSIMAGTAITFGTNSKLYGCALAQTAVTFESGGSVVLNHYEGNNLIL